MDSSTVFSITTFVYGFACILYVVFWIFKSSVSGKIATSALISGSLLNIAGIGMRWSESYKLGFGHAPLSNLFESLTFFSLTIALLYLFIEFKYKKKVLGVFASPMVFLSIAYASLGVNSKIAPLMPALKSNWLIAHVFTCFLGYAAFAIACGISMMYLIKISDTLNKISIVKQLPDIKILDDLTYKMIVFGFFFLTLGIITGAVWANSAWGRYWGWDPKETWSLITWFIYATLLHARLMKGWAGKQIAYLSIFGFTAVLFTYFGVNYLSGLHSYSK